MIVRSAWRGTAANLINALHSEDHLKNTSSACLQWVVLLCGAIVATYVSIIVVKMCRKRERKLSVLLNLHITSGMIECILVVIMDVVVQSLFRKFEIVSFLYFMPLKFNLKGINIRINLSQVYLKFFISNNKLAFTLLIPTYECLIVHTNPQTTQSTMRNNVLKVPQKQYYVTFAHRTLSSFEKFQYTDEAATHMCIS